MTDPLPGLPEDLENHIDEMFPRQTEERPNFGAPGSFTNIAFDAGVLWERRRIVQLLEIGGPIEQIICDYWGNPDFDKDDALELIEQAIQIKEGKQ
jgi:hypothetical protein